jgi:hypothetical protein
MKRIWRALLIILAVPGLFLAASYPVGQGRVGQDTRWCNSAFAAYPNAGEPEWIENVQRCIDSRRAKRWGPWNAWTALVRNNED